MIFCIRIFSTPCVERWQDEQWYFLLSRYAIILRKMRKKKDNKNSLSSMFLFCILNFCVEAYCLEYALDILIWSKPLKFLKQIFLHYPCHLRYCWHLTQSNPTQWRSTHSAQAIKMNNNWYMFVCFWYFTFL